MDDLRRVYLVSVNTVVKKAPQGAFLLNANYLVATAFGLADGFFLP